MTAHNKLIRDKIPDIIKSEGDSCETHIATENEFWEKLKEKLLEEVNAFIEKENLEELGDVIEVIESIKEFKQWGNGKIEKTRVEKKINKGGFDERIILMSD